jgi:hypothetical protein
MFFSKFISGKIFSKIFRKNFVLCFCAPILGPIRGPKLKPNYIGLDLKTFKNKGKFFFYPYIYPFIPTYFKIFY